MIDFLKRNKFLLIQISILIIGIIIYFNLLNGADLYLGKLESDFQTQHIRLIEYMRQNFFETHDLIPQLSLNLGGTTNFADLYYYGMYNPFIMLSYLFPGISTPDWMQIVYGSIIVLTYIAMHNLLVKHNIKYHIIIALSLVAAFAPPILNHMSHHIMFIYYFPIMIFSLIAIRNLIEKNIKYQFIICVALILFTNFFFALTIGFIQLLYFILVLYFEKKLDAKERRKALGRLIFSYLVGILIGMLPFLVQADVLLRGDRLGVEKLIPKLYRDALNELFVSKYAFGLGVFYLYALVSSLVNFKNKFSLVGILILFLFTFSGHLNYILNVFQYIHAKAFIYFIPLVLVIVAINLNEMTNKKKLISILGTLLFVMIYFIGITKVPPLKNYFSDYYLIMILQFIVLVVLSFNFNKIVLVVSIISSLVLVYFTVNNCFNSISKQSFNKDVLNVEQVDYSDNDFYRQSYKVNTAPSLNTRSALMYTSLLNENYYKFFNDFLELETTSYNRMKKNAAIDNQILRKYFGITHARDKFISKDVHPFIHGVEDKDVYRLNDLEKLSKMERMIALNDGVFIEGEKQSFVKSKVEPKIVYDKPLTNKGKSIIIDVPDYQDGLYQIVIEAKGKLKGKDEFVAKSHKATIKKKNIYGEPEVRRGTIFLDSAQAKKNITLEVPKYKNNYQNIKVLFYKKSDIDQKDYKVIKATNPKSVNNKGYNFDIDMKNNGYISSSIYYDTGYTIKIDNKEVKKEKINDMFLGAKIEKGKHHVDISYEMPSFKLALALSGIGLFILGFIMIDEIKIFNKSFFRFGLVGVFNTINYFVMYTILLKLLPYGFAHIIGFVYSAFVSYFITTMYTFKTKPSIKTFIAFPLTYLPNLIMSTFGTMFLVEFNIIGQQFASLTMMLLAIPITYIVNRLIFTKKKREVFQ
ncbi:MAG: YfhO family protein [Erysipelotrichales bacterium]